MKRMAELIRKFFEMNDMDVLIIAFLYFATVIGLWIYTCRKWKEEENDKKRQSGSDHRHGRQARR